MSWDAEMVNLLSSWLKVGTQRALCQEIKRWNLLNWSSWLKVGTQQCCVRTYWRTKK